MNIGEFGNFLSYAYAPASVVAPLGTVCGSKLKLHSRTDSSSGGVNSQLRFRTVNVEGTTS